MRHFRLLPLAVFLVVACKHEISFKNDATRYENIQSFFSKNGVALQSFSANNSNSINLTTAKGNKISFPSNAFVTMNDIPVTGNINFEVKEITEPGEMILSNKPTVSKDGILESGGEFFIRATQNGQELKLAKNTLLKIEVVVDSLNMQNMRVFNGTITPDSSIIWTVNNNQGNGVFLDSMRINAVMMADSLQWLNIDKFVNEPKITYTINEGNTPNLNATRTFIHFTGRNTAVNYTPDIATKMIAASATIVGICIIDNKIYSSISTVNMQNGGSTTLNFVQTTEDDLKQKLKLLK